MHATVLHRFGPAENLTYQETATPAPGPGQVRVAVAAAGVHVIDTALRAGRTGGPLALPELPTIPGREVAGTVDALGEGTPAGWLGTRVAVHLGAAPGGYAEYAVTDAARPHPLPDVLSAEHALAMIGTGRTTLGILRFANLSPGDTVLVLAAAGGVGSLLVQHAVAAGATVVGAAGGPAKATAVRELGAHLAVDYHRPDWAETVRTALGDRRPVHHVFEGIGGELGAAAIELLAPGGHHLSYGSFTAAPDGTLDPLPSPERRTALGITSERVVGPPMLARIGGPDGVRTLEEEALGHAAAGTLVPRVHRFPLADAAGAHRALECRNTLGKVVLIP